MEEDLGELIGEPFERIQNSIESLHESLAKDVDEVRIVVLVKRDGSVFDFDPHEELQNEIVLPNDFVAEMSIGRLLGQSLQKELESIISI